MSIITAEIVGTALLILFGDGVVATVILKKEKGEGSGWIVITLGWGFAVMVGAYAVGQFDGAHLNPAVTLGLWIHGSITGAQAWHYFIGEAIGAFIGAVLVFLAHYQHFGETEDQGTKLAVFCTAPAIRNYYWNFITEVIGTFALVFGILAITATGNHVGGAGYTNLGTLLVAFLVVAIGMSLGGPTGYAINPTRDLMPRIAHALLPIPGKGGSDWAYAWVPVVGPLVGAAIAAGVYAAVFPS